MIYFDRSPRTNADLAVSTASPSVGVRRRQWVLLLLCMGVYMLVFALYYPPLSAIEDEVGFVNQAIVWSKGAISAEAAGYDTMLDFIDIKGRVMSWRNPGRSLIILPFVAVWGIRSTFVTGALIHLAITLVAAFVHKTLGQSPLWAILVLCHPTLSIYSRTIMGDSPAGLFVLASVLIILSRPKPGFLAGTLLGLGAVMRYHVVIILPFLGAALWGDPTIERPKLESLKCMAAGSTVAALLGLYNLGLYGSVWGAAARGYFSWRFLLTHIVFYSFALLLIWPGMFAALLLDRSRISLLTRFVCFPVVLLFSFYYFHDRGSWWGEDVVLGQRLIQCVLPVCVVAYASVLSRTAVPWLRRLVRAPDLAAAGVPIVLLLFAQGYAFRKHQDHLQRLGSVRDEVIATVPAGATIVANYMVQKLFGIADPMLPRYSWVRLDTAVLEPSNSLTRLGQPWYCGVVPKGPDDPALKDLPEFLNRYHLRPIPTHTPGLLLYFANR